MVQIHFPAYQGGQHTHHIAMCSFFYRHISRNQFNRLGNSIQIYCVGNILMQARVLRATGSVPKPHQPLLYMGTLMLGVVEVSYMCIMDWVSS